VVEGVVAEGQLHSVGLEDGGVVHLALQDLIRRTGLTIDYRYKLDSIDLWETVVTNNDKSSLKGRPLPQLATLAA